MAVIIWVVSRPPDPADEVCEPQYGSDTVGNAHRKNPECGEHKNQMFQQVLMIAKYDHKIRIRI